MQIGAASTMEIGGPVLSGSPLADVNNNASPIVVPSAQTVDFAASSGVLQLDDIDAFAGTIGAFGPGDEIFAGGTTIVSETFINNTLTVFGGGGVTLGTLAFAPGVAGAATSQLTSRAASRARHCASCPIPSSPPPSGEKKVQALEVGDLVTTARGESRPITWIGVGRVLAISRTP